MAELTWQGWLTIATVIGALGHLDDAHSFLAQSQGADMVDVVFVDVALMGSRDDGLSLVRAWSSRPDAPMFVLATAVESHAIEAFALGVHDYVLKPYDPQRLLLCLERLRTRRAPPRLPSSPPRIVARRGRSLIFLELSEVWAFESRSRLTVVHGPRGTHEVDLSLHTIEMTFAERFFRVHRNWLVNIAHVRELSREGGSSSLHLGGDAGSSLEVPIARDRAQIVRERLLAGGVGIRNR